MLLLAHKKQLQNWKEVKNLLKNFYIRHNIPTAAYQSFNASNVEEGYTFLETLKPPYVLKADGLAAGKGVLILNDLNEAKAELKKHVGRC